MMKGMPARTKTPSAAQLAESVEKAVAALDALEKGLGITAPPISAVVKRHTARFKKGGDKVVAVIGDLAGAKGLESGVLQVAQMNEQLATGAALMPLVLRLAKLSARIDDIIFGQRAAAWKTAMDFYAILQRQARSDAGIARGLQPVTKFMSMHDPRKKRPPGGPTRASEKSAKKAVAVLERNAPELLATPGAQRKT
jgi:hypothetical protein